jgi:hypothetical protein
MRKVLALLAFIVSVFTLASCGSSHGASVNARPESLVGEWHQVNSNPNGWMTASISGESIQVNLRGRDSSSIFWLGSFDTHRSANKFKVVSLGDQDAMKYKIAASDESQKTFTYDHGVLSFEFSALGSSTTIHMTKSKSVRTPTSTPTTPKSKAYKPANRPTPQKTRTSKIASPPKISTRKK